MESIKLKKKETIGDGFVEYSKIYICKKCGHKNKIGIVVVDSKWPGKELDFSCQECGDKEKLKIGKE